MWLSLSVPSSFRHILIPTTGCHITRKKNKALIVMSSNPIIKSIGVKGCGYKFCLKVSVLEVKRISY